MTPIQALELLAEGKVADAFGRVWTGFDKDDAIEFSRRVLSQQPVPYTITETGRAMLRDAQQSSPDRQQGVE